MGHNSSFIDSNIIKIIEPLGSFLLPHREVMAVGVHYCNERCRFNDNPDQRCDGSPVSHYNRRCLSWRPRPRGDDYREMMRTYKIKTLLAGVTSRAASKAC